VHEILFHVLQAKRTRLRPADHFELGASIEKVFRSKRFMPEERVTETAILNNIPGYIFS